jgi:hypothetical protein
MNKFYRFRFLIFLFLLLPFFLFFGLPRILKKQDICQISDKEAKKYSAQNNENIFNEVFGNKSCHPNQLNLRIPANAIKINNAGIAVKSNNYTPKISTIIVSSYNEETFKIKRIDRNKNEYLYSDKESCLAWQWIEQQGNKVLNLSMERNLQINTSNTTEIIFLVFLPIEIIDAKSQIVLNKYIKEEGGNSSSFNLRDYPEIQKILKQDFPENNNYKLETPIVEELENVINQGGIFYNKSFDDLIDAQYKKTYKNNSDTSNCAIPKDWH